MTLREISAMANDLRAIGASGIAGAIICRAILIVLWATDKPAARAVAAELNRPKVDIASLIG
jgi:hypothetical protein